MRDKTEIIIFDHTTGRKRKIVLNKNHFRLVKFSLFFLIFLSIASIILGVNLYYINNRNDSLVKENAALKLELKKQSTNLSILENQFVKVKDLTLKVKKLLHWNVVSGEKVARGDGEEEVGVNVESPLASRIDEVLSDPSLHYSEIREDLESVIDQFRDKLSYLTSVPSIWPVKGWITSGFGYRISPFTHGLEFHEGVDIANALGTPIKAPAEGYVLYAGWARGYGNVLILGHGYGISTIYGHLSKILVKQGQHVYRGDIIALMGTTGRSTGPHLHYEVRVNGVPVNPLNYIIEK